MEERLPEQIVPPTGVVHRVTGEYIHVPEMVPELVVPDLTDFQLKPYVSYKAKEITQKELSPKDIFNSVYAADIEDDFRDGRIKLEGDKVIFADGRILALDSFDSSADEDKSVAETTVDRT